MAVRRSVSETVGEEKAGRKGKKLPRWAIWGLVVLGALALFWYKTNSWPVVAMVGLRPVTRGEVTRALLKQGGKAEVESLITEMLVKKELDKLGVKVEASEVEAKIREIKASLGEGVNFDELIASRGMTPEEFREQLELQMRLEKTLADKTAVTEADIDKYMADSQGLLSSTDSAQRQQVAESLRINKLQQAAPAWVEELKAKTWVWRLPGF